MHKRSHNQVIKIEICDRYNFVATCESYTEHVQQRSKIKLQEQRGVWRRFGGVLSRGGSRIVNGVVHLNFQLG